ncbi:MAG: DUF418 domain-containing protein [Planctomycetes bacterium]|nr:DUF418 domain-containing protein [Planctomycetota bacterium]
MSTIPTPPLPARDAAGPVAEAERIVALDVVRGLAVLGILVMNVVEFGLPLTAYDNPAYAGGHRGADLATWFVQVVFFDGKMRALFSMLFGAGLVLLAERMTRRGQAAGVADLLLRRCLWLVPFGVLHRFALQWTGDILYQYGLLGVVAVAFRNLRARTLIVLGLVALTAFVPIGLLQYGRSAKVRAQAAEAVRLEDAGEKVPEDLAAAKKRWDTRLASIPPKPEALQKEVDALRAGYPAVFAHRWDYHHTFQSAYLYYHFVWDVLGMFLVGMGLMKLGFFAGACRTGVYAAWIAAGGVAAAAVAAWAAAWTARDFSPGAIELQLVRQTTYSFTRLVLALAWASALLLVVRAGRAPVLTGALAAVGRMAFSNYVLQTVCCTLLFFGYGLGLHGRLSRSMLMGVMLGVSLVQVCFSLVWLRRFRFGPLEWAWRSLTWWRVQPLRRSVSGPVAADPA